MAVSPAHPDSHAQEDTAAHGGEHGHGDAAGGHGHGLSHILPLKVLVGTWAALMVLTVLTVTVRSIDLGANINLAVAMLIATVKATLVCLFFMHLRYDKLFHTIVFVSAILLATLFVSFALMDGDQYQSDVAWGTDDTGLAPPPY